MATLELSDSQFRRLLDLVYVGNYVLNTHLEDNRIEEYDQLQSKIFSYCHQLGMKSLADKIEDDFYYPSDAFQRGGIHEAIAYYDDETFFEILSQEFAMRDLEMDTAESNQDMEKIAKKMEEYLVEFSEHGLDNVVIANDDCDDDCEGEY